MGYYICSEENKLGEVNNLADHRHFEYLIFQRFNLFYGHAIHRLKE